MTTQEPESPKELAEGQTNPTAKPELLARIGAAFSGWLPSTPTDSGPKDAKELAETRTSLATTRTLMAADRTLMAWVRTALSMISFGFTIYKILQGFQDSGEALVKQQYEPRTVGLFLIGMGTISMVLGTIEYWRTLKDLRQIQYFHIWRPSFVIAMIISVTGLSMFVSITAQIL